MSDYDSDDEVSYTTFDELKEFMKTHEFTMDSTNFLLANYQSTENPQESLEIKDVNGQTALVSMTDLYAEDDLETYLGEYVIRLLDAGADINAVDLVGRTPYELVLNAPSVEAYEPGDPEYEMRQTLLQRLKPEQDASAIDRIIQGETLSQESSPSLTPIETVPGSPISQDESGNQVDLNTAFEIPRSAYEAAFDLLGLRRYNQDDSEDATSGQADTTAGQAAPQQSMTEQDTKEEDEEQKEDPELEMIELTKQDFDKMQQRVRVNITKTVEFEDPIMLSTENINIEQYILEDPDNIVIVYDKNRYFFTNKDTIERQYNDSIVYPCKIADSMSPESVIRTLPLYDLKKIGFYGGYYCDMKQYFNNAGSQLFALINLEKKYPSFVSDNVLNQGGSLVSALYCQSGQDSKISVIIPAVPSTEDNPDTIQLGGMFKKNYKKRLNSKKYSRKHKKNSKKHNKKSSKKNYRK